MAVYNLIENIGNPKFERRFFSSVFLLAKPPDLNKRETKKKRENKNVPLYTGHFTNSTHNYFIQLQPQLLLLQVSFFSSFLQYRLSM